MGMRHQSPPSRKALETMKPDTRSNMSPAWHQSPPSRKALETVRRRLRLKCSTSPGIKAHPAERHWRPPRRAMDLRAGCSASKPTQPKGIGDRNFPESPQGDHSPGIKAHPAERHWRHPRAVVVRNSPLHGIKAHPAERHWRQVARPVDFWDSDLVASKPTQPKGIGDTFRSRCPLVRWFGIKAHPAERHWRHNKPLAEGIHSHRRASKPTQPKGIGDETCDF